MNGIPSYISDPSLYLALEGIGPIPSYISNPSLYIEQERAYLANKRRTSKSLLSCLERIKECFKRIFEWIAKNIFCCCNKSTTETNPPQSHAGTDKSLPGSQASSKDFVPSSALSQRASILPPVPVESMPAVSAPAATQGASSAANEILPLPSTTISDESATQLLEYWLKQLPEALEKSFNQTETPLFMELKMAELRLLQMGDPAKKYEYFIQFVDITLAFVDKKLREKPQGDESAFRISANSLAEKVLACLSKCEELSKNTIGQLTVVEKQKCRKSSEVPPEHYIYLMSNRILHDFIVDSILFPQDKYFNYYESLSNKFMDKNRELSKCFCRDFNRAFPPKSYVD